MNTGDTVSHYMLGPQLGQGGFGKIFAARDVRDGKVYAMKAESEISERKSLEFETKVLERIKTVRYFPQIREHGVYHNYHWLTLELIGPSLSAILKDRPGHKFSLSTALRTSVHVLRAVKSLHALGFIHRDIKPANILVRLSHGLPLCLIDFGLVRVYRDQKTHAHLPPRQHTGFRGTKTYASMNAHVLTDLSRRDDLVSWMYFTLMIMLGSLPWQGINDNSEVMRMKREYDINKEVQDVCPEFAEVWPLIGCLRFEDDPDYDAIETVLIKACESRGYKGSDPYDWDEYVKKYKDTLARNFGVKFNDEGKDPTTYMTELGLPPAVLLGIAGLKQPLLNGRKDYREQSTMQLSELNEKDEVGCCC